MKRFSLSAAACALALTTFALGGCTKKDEAAPAAQTGEFTLELDNIVGFSPAGAAVPLVLSTNTYKNTNGDNFAVTTFKYYLSNVQLRKADGSTYAVPDSYFLVDQANADSKSITMKNVPVGDYSAISFVVGVDSARTKAGNFTGVLNANSGMFWDWSKEFINLRFEGTSPQSPTGGLIFHVAGYKGGNGANNTIRTLTLPFPSAGLLVRADHSPEIHTYVNVLKLFTGPNPATTPPAPFQNPVSFATVYNKMGGPAAVKIADNIAAGMFTVSHIHAN